MRRPHIIHVFDTEQVYSGEKPRLVDSIDWSYLGHCPALVVPETPSKAYADFDVVSQEPYSVFVDSNYAYAFKLGGLIKWEDSWLVIDAAPRVYSAGIIYSYVMFVASKVSFKRFDFDQSWALPPQAKDPRFFSQVDSSLALPSEGEPE